MNFDFLNIADKNTIANPTAMETTTTTKMETTTTTTTMETTTTTKIAANLTGKQISIMNYSIVIEIILIGKCTNFS